jgi:hypothetical protein
MPSELVAGIDRIERKAPHPDTATTTSLGLAAWAEGLPAGDSDLLDPGAGTAVRWTSESGWQENPSVRLRCNGPQVPQADREAGPFEHG